MDEREACSNDWCELCGAPTLHRDLRKQTVGPDTRVDGRGVERAAGEVSSGGGE